MGYLAEARFFIPQERTDENLEWTGHKAGVPTWDDGPAQDHDYGAIGVQEKIWYNWAYDTNLCSCFH